MPPAIQKYARYTIPAAAFAPFVMADRKLFHEVLEAIG